ncbi:MAG: NAD(+) diphosphatase [Propionivibrio sp.]
MSEMETAPYWLVRMGGEFVVRSDGPPGNVFPCARASAVDDRSEALRVGEWQGAPCYAIEVEALPESIAGETVPVRSVFGLAGAEAFALVCRAAQLLDWKKNHRYCGRCGTPTSRKAREFAMQCPSCGLLTYPRISPAVMVLIRRGDELLLARSPHFRPGMFSALAGFVEAGETLEQCAVREVREEVGVEIANLRYFQSQPWPFPDSLMLAFFADYAGGDITPDPVEIAEAGWFPIDALPGLPDPVSIARRLIDAAVLTKS